MPYRQIYVYLIGIVDMRPFAKTSSSQRHEHAIKIGINVKAPRTSLLADKTLKIWVLQGANIIKHVCMHG